MADINLLNPESEAQSSLAASSKKWLVRIVGLIFILVLAYYAYLFVYGLKIDRDVKNAEDAVAEYQAQINENSRRQELVTRQGQLNNLNTILDNHLYWSKILPELARVTVQSARYNNIDLGDEGSMEVTVTLPSYAEADKYLQVFNLPQYNEQFSNVIIRSLARGQEGDLNETTMRLELMYNTEFLKK